ncbi:MAG: hypothetical protein ACO3QC_12845, partial [Phycisphaerales bacterium]
AQVWLPGDSIDAVLAAARRRTLMHAGQTIPLWVAAFFCVMMPRPVYEAVGDLDEAYFPGYYEDDDYCYRVRAAGYEIGCAEDVFVYHELSASFNLDGAAKRQALLSFTSAVVEKEGCVSDAELAEFREAGYDDKAAIETIAAITLMTFTNLYNHVHDTALDFPPVPAV